LDRSQKAKPKKEFFKQKLREALVDTNLYSSVTIDQSMKAINPDTDIPDSLIKAYYTMLQNGVKVRTTLDGDYDQVKGTGRF
jgi:hypothetical protein